MSTGTIDYDALARQAGAIRSVAAPAGGAAPDYVALARQAGATGYAPPAPAAPAPMEPGWLARAYQAVKGAAEGAGDAVAGAWDYEKAHPLTGGLQFDLGAAKGALHTLGDVGAMTLAGSSPQMAAQVAAWRAAPPPALRKIEDAATPTNPMQAFGRGTEQAAEYLVPFGDEEKGAELLGKTLADGKLARAVARGAVNVGTDAAVGAAQGRNVGNVAAASAAGNAAGEAIGALAPHVRPLAWWYNREAPISRTALAAGEVATPEEIAQVATRDGIPLTAGEVYGRGSDVSRDAAARTVRGLQNRMEAHTQAATDALRGALGRWQDELAPPGTAEAELARHGPPLEPEEAGQRLSASAEAARQRENNGVGSIFEALDEELAHHAPEGAPARGGLVSFGPLQEGARELTGELAEARKAVPALDPKTAGRLADDLASIQKNLTPAAPRQEAGFTAGTAPKPEAPKGLTFRAAQQIRSRLWDIGHVPSDVLPGEAQKVARRLIGHLDQAMEAAAKGSSPRALALWRKGNQAWQRYAETFGTQGHVLNRLVSAGAKDYEGLPAYLLSNANGGSLSHMEALKEAGVDLAPLRREFLRKGLGSGTRPSLASLADLASDYSPEFLRALFDRPEELAGLNALRRRGLVEGIVSPNGYEDLERAGARLKRAASSTELEDMLGTEGARRLRVYATIGRRALKPFNPSGTGPLEAAREEIPGTKRSAQNFVERRWLGNVLDPRTTEARVGLPTLPAGSPGTAGPPGPIFGALAAAARRGALEVPALVAARGTPHKLLSGANPH